MKQHREEMVGKVEGGNYSGSFHLNTFSTFNKLGFKSDTLTVYLSALLMGQHNHKIKIENMVNGSYFYSIPFMERKEKAKSFKSHKVRKIMNILTQHGYFRYDSDKKCYFLVDQTYANAKLVKKYPKQLKINSLGNSKFIFDLQTIEEYKNGKIKSKNYHSFIVSEVVGRLSNGIPSFYDFFLKNFGISRHMIVKAVDSGELDRKEHLINYNGQSHNVYLSEEFEKVLSIDVDYEDFKLQLKKEVWANLGKDLNQLEVPKTLLEDTNNPESLEEMVIIPELTEDELKNSFLYDKDLQHNKWAVFYTYDKNGKPVWEKTEDGYKHKLTYLPYYTYFRSEKLQKKHPIEHFKTVECRYSKEAKDVMNPKYKGQPVYIDGKEIILDNLNRNVLDILFKRGLCHYEYVKTGKNVLKQNQKNDYNNWSKIQKEEKLEDNELINQKNGYSYTKKEYKLISKFSNKLLNWYTFSDNLLYTNEFHKNRIDARERILREDKIHTPKYKRDHARNLYVNRDGQIANPTRTWERSYIEFGSDHLRQVHMKNLSLKHGSYKTQRKINKNNKSYEEELLKRAHLKNDHSSVKSIHEQFESIQDRCQRNYSLWKNEQKKIQEKNSAYESSLERKIPKTNLENFFE